MKIIERSNIDIIKWNKLVEITPDASVFSYSWYLDSTAQNWCVLVNEDYSKGIALPYTIHFGIKVLYTPIFVRYIEWLGIEVDFNSIDEIIRSYFSNIHISIKQPLLGDNYKSYTFQKIPFNTYRNISTQANRSLKKAINNDLNIEKSINFFGVESIIKSELTDKFKGINKSSIKILSNLFKEAQNEKKILVYEIKDSGGIVCINHNNNILYLKGALINSHKKMGGMYMCMDRAINEAIKEGKTFDFGGSRIDGVKKFNNNLGGKDFTYFEYTFDNTPIWFKLVRAINRKWIKKLF